MKTSRNTAVLMGLAFAGSALAADTGTLLIAEPGSTNLWTSAGPQGKPPRYSDKLIHRRVESCVAVGMIIESDGSTSAHRVLKVSMYPRARQDAPDLRALVEQWGIDMAKTYRYVPGPDNPGAEPAYTANVFAANRGTGSKDLQGECEITDLRETLARLNVPPAG